MPRQPPPEHVWFTHAMGLPHVPLEEQVSTPLLLEHVVAFGEQTPTQAPETHACPAQVVGVPHCPLEPQVWICVSDEHWVAFGVHTPVQLPAEHTKGQAVPETHVPVESQVCGMVPEHRAAPGTQTPVHVPLPVQTYGHALVVVHVPEELQVWELLPEHCIGPGVQAAPASDGWVPPSPEAASADGPISAPAS
jgi:hypothetical protein